MAREGLASPSRQTAMPLGFPHKKRAVRHNERPKSREETPKEGCDAHKVCLCRSAQSIMRRIIDNCVFCRAGAEKMQSPRDWKNRLSPQNSTLALGFRVIKKGRPATDGPSLGRKRPSRATIAPRCERAQSRLRCAASRNPAINPNLARTD
jgi:hypothetical protein